jgi:uncharacterized protein (TIGR03083 family)
MTTPSAVSLADIDPFDLFDLEAARLDRFLSSLDAEGWARPSRCAGWSVRDVLGHLAGEELYNHACLDGHLDGFLTLIEREGAGGGFDGFNDWCVRRSRELPVEQVLQEWRAQNGETRERMRELGRDGTLQTLSGPYPAGSQTFHYDSEYAAHADDVGAPVPAEEAERRTRWRLAVGLFVLAEQGSKARIEPSAERVLVHADGEDAQLSPADFVDATVGRLPADHPLAPRIRATLRCLA